MHYDIHQHIYDHCHVLSYLIFYPLVYNLATYPVAIKKKLSKGVKSTIVDCFRLVYDGRSLFLVVGWNLECEFISIFLY